MNTLKTKVGWSCPSNIAIVKYWGKYGRQLPKNPSISLTLKNAVSKTTIAFKEKKASHFATTFMLDGLEKPSFQAKIEKFFSSILDILPFINDFDFEIESSNTFPHSSGIASSASGMAAMAMCLCEIENIIGNNNASIDIQKVSSIARLGSGSASRSVIPELALWGGHEAFPGSHQEYAISISNEVHEVFKNFHDDILIVSDSEKAVSSTAGHNLMNENIYAKSRYEQAYKHIGDLKTILSNGDVENFGLLAEAEALTLHALMMSSNPSYILMQPSTIAVIQKIRKFREDTNCPIYFTLDAGPNVHILYPDHVLNLATEFINNELLMHSSGAIILKDGVGMGPQCLIL